MRTVSVGVVLAAVVAFAACARPYAPPGGERDVTPPRLIGTTPEPLAVVAPSDEPVIFEFDDGLSERNFSEALVVVSPLDGALRVDRAGNEVRVRIDGGWRADRVYRIVLLPGILDRFGNARKDAVELVFSTGPPVASTALAGIVFDRITGEPALNPVIDAVRRADGARYMAVSDSGGFFSLRHLPPGVYDLMAYADANRNRRRDALEPVDSGQVVSIAATDTVTQMFQVLSPDSTAPNVNNAVAVDSLHVRVVLDDYVSADAAAAATAAVQTLPDSAAFAGATEIMLATVYAAAQMAAPRPPPSATDSVVGDSTARVDPVAAARADSLAAVQATRSRARADSAMAAAGALPARELIVRLDRPLVAGREYLIVISGITNLHGLTGGGADDFETEPPPAPREPPPAATDTSAAVLPRRM